MDKIKFTRLLLIQTKVRFIDILLANIIARLFCERSCSRHAYVHSYYTQATVRYTFRFSAFDSLVPELRMNGQACRAHGRSFCAGAYRMLNNAWGRWNASGKWKPRENLFPTTVAYTLEKIQYCGQIYRWIK